MSASLVGSEMCIRDRAPPAPARAEALGSGAGGVWVVSDSPSEGDWEEPVSYTHLTLPTICSV
eukprot:2602592-Alexandrium_andersonii.AAC.1